MLKSVQLQNVDLNLLVVFSTVFKRLHVGRAASELGLSPSAVSHALARLRELFNDPLFLRTPRGVLPNDRARELAPPIGDILLRVSGVVASSAPFEPRSSDRRFSLGMPDATAAVLLSPLLGQLRGQAPHIGLSVREFLPIHALTALEAQEVDLAIAAIRSQDAAPARFVSQRLYQEEFVIAARADHPFLKSPTLKQYCAAEHVLTSARGDRHGFVDDALAARHVQRRVVLTVSNFMLALAAVANTDLLAAMPRAFASEHGVRFGIRYVEPPFSLSRQNLCVVTLRSASLDAGLEWLVQTLVQSARRAGESTARSGGRSRRRSKSSG